MPGQPRAGLVRRIHHALATCSTEADIALVLWNELKGEFGYNVIAVVVLEREDWFHGVAVEAGLLQDLQRRRLAESFFAPYYNQASTVVIHPPAGPAPERARGPGAGRHPHTLIFVPVRHQGELIGAGIYQTYERREVPPEELALLEKVHANLGVVLSNAWLNRITRNQALRLTALNAVARALSSTQDEGGIVSALCTTLAPLIPVDRVELAVPMPEPGSRVRLLRAHGERLTRLDLPESSAQLGLTREVLRTRQSVLVDELDSGDSCRSAICVPINEGDHLIGTLSVLSTRSEAYEQSTLGFLEQVADQVALALRNAWSYAKVEAQRRRLEVLNAVGRRLATSLDSWSIMRALREELSRHLAFDIFSLATITDTAGGPVLEGYVYDSGHEQPLTAVPLAATGPSRRAYETGEAVLIRRSPWARELESHLRGEDRRVYGAHAVLQVTRPGRSRRVASRSIIWVPVRHGDKITALLSLQSYRADAFNEWHVSLLQDIAAQTALALATARHFEDAQAQRRRLETILRHSPVGVVLEDSNGLVVYANAMIDRLYGVSGQALIGREATRLLQETGAIVVPDPDGETSPGGPVDYRIGERIVRVLRVPIPSHGEQSRGVLSLHEDVTEERAVMEAKDLMLRAIGHEVRSPAAAMRSTIAALVQWGDIMDHSQRRDLIASAYDQSERLLRLVENQLTIAKLETRQFEPNVTVVSLQRMLDEVVSVLRSRYGRRVEAVERRLESTLADALCEASHLQQVLTNLIGNALEHANATRVVVEACQRGGMLEVTVADNGGGLPPDKLGNLFERSEAAGQHRARGGLGLGLYLCRLVVERSFGGRIWLEETGSSGTTFKFTVPAALETPQLVVPRTR